MTGLKESIWVVLARWGVGVMLRSALETHVDVYIKELEEHMKARPSGVYDGNSYEIAVDRMFKFLKGEM